MESMIWNGDIVKKGDVVKIGVGADNRCTPFTSKYWLRNVTATVLSVSEFRSKRHGPAFTCKIGNVVKVVGLGRTDLYQPLTESEFVLFKLEE